MSNEKTPVAGCDASIMKNVWRIRERDYGQKLQMEQDRMENSALPSINQDWANRLAAKPGGFKRVQRKIQPTENQTENNDVWKSKMPQVPRGGGFGPQGRPGKQSGGFSTPAPKYKDKKGQDKNSKRLQLLMFITQTQPSAMMWGKSWKYNKSLSLPVEGAEAGNWGQCWMFATQQPYSEPGKPWLNGPNLLDPHNLHLWKKPGDRVVESKELDLSLATEEWKMSWRKSDPNNKKKDASSVSGESVAKYGCFTLLVETQHHNEVLCSSEWSDSWKSNKQDHFTVPNNGLMNESIAEKKGKDGEMSYKWDECWKLVNHHGCKLPQVKKSHNSEWANSWRTAMLVSNNHKSSDPTQDHSDIFDDCSQQRESHLQKVMFVSHEKKRSDLYLQLCNEFNVLTEWSKSWQVTKNNSKPCDELEKVLKVLPPKGKTASDAQKVESNQKAHYSTSEQVDSRYEQLKHCVIYIPKRKLTQSQLNHLRHPENVLSVSEWKDSWKTLKHRMRMERRRMRPDPSRPFGASERGEDMNPTASEWNDSWRFTCQSLRQETEAWQQGWSTTPQVRVDRARDRDHFAPVEIPKNGPTGERSWAESWRFLRHQRRTESGQGSAQTSQVRSSVASHHPGDSRAQRRYSRSVSDWQAAWMVSETPFHHDRPSLTQWREAWRWSIFHTEQWTEQVPRENEVDVLMEIQPQREKISLQRVKAKMSQSFDNQIFRERYPEKQWDASWRAGSLLNNILNHDGSSGIPEKSMSNTIQQQDTTENGHGTKWGRSFRIANPMPHVERPWVECSPNPVHYAEMWSSGKNKQININTNFSHNPATFRLWGNSHRFLQGASAQIKNKTKSKKPVDSWVIITNKTKTRMHLYTNIEKEKQSVRKWAGCHLLGKTQPRPKRVVVSAKNRKMEDQTQDKFFEEWADSWMFSVRPGGPKKPVKSLIGWDESWKFLLPPYPQMNGPKTK